ncbi:MAG TPA: hypothetical protein VGM15_08485 [Burkholderiaceae bacterium]|jgi:hypothetical protein
MPDVNPSRLVVYAAIAALIAWRLYSRVRRLVGRQTMNPSRAWTSVVAFSALLALLASSSIAQPLSAAALAAGAGLGAALGLYGLRVTRFEVEAGGFFYTPSAHLGIALSLLVAARVIYRLVQMPFAAAPAHAPPAAFVRSPLTLVLVGMLGAYYITYAIGLLRWRRRADCPSPPKTATPDPGAGFTPKG